MSFSWSCKQGSSGCLFAGATPLSFWTATASTTLSLPTPALVAGNYTFTLTVSRPLSVPVCQTLLAPNTATATIDVQVRVVLCSVFTLIRSARR